MATPSPHSSKPWEHAKAGAGSGTDPLAARFVESLSYDTRLYDADIRGSVAHARMLRSVGLISDADLAAITRGLAEIRTEIEAAPAGPTSVGIPSAWPGWKTELEDVHMCIEAALVAKIGDAGRRLHTGRSRNDQVALDLRLWIRDAAARLAASCDEVLAALEDLAQRQGDIVLPGYTHMQRAQPICLGGELMAWHAMLGRDRRGFEALRSNDAGASQSPLGSGALAGSSLPLDRGASAALLDLSSVSSSSIDATASRDEALDLLFTLSKTAMHLSRLAEQWVIYATTEFAFLDLDDRYTTGSSMMPQKRNPDMLELIRGRCGGVYGDLMAVLTIGKGLPRGYNRDLQEDKRHVFAAYDTVVDSLAMAARIVRTTRFDQARIDAGGAGGLERGHLDATSLAEYLVTLGVPFRTAHQIVGSLVLACEQSGRHSLAQLSLDEFGAAMNVHGQGNVALGPDLYDWLGAKNVVKRYRTAGNAGFSGYRAALTAALGRRAESAQAAPESLAPAEPTAGRDQPAPPTSGPGGGRATAPALFDGPEISAHDGAIIGAYKSVGRTLDDLPYTTEFERLYAAVAGGADAPNKREVFHRLHNLRKAGRLPRVGRSGSPAGAPPPRIEPAEEDLLRGMVMQSVGSLGQRDQLPYTDTFDTVVEAFNQRTGRALEPHSVWRLIAKLAK